MENIDELKLIRQQLVEQVNANHKAIEDKLKSFLSSHCVRGNVDLYLTSDIRFRYNYNSKFTLMCNVGFMTDDPERIKKGWQSDFGSTFYLDINETYIEINKGTIGTYRSSDKYQVARDHFISNIWDNEDLIIEIIKENLCVETWDELENYCRIHLQK